jgi:hypothetical protein
MKFRIAATRLTPGEDRVISLPVRYFELRRMPLARRQVWADVRETSVSSLSTQGRKLGGEIGGRHAIRRCPHSIGG